MKLVKKWLFPVLTCLIIAGAAVLPPYISRLRDAGQFGQVHAQLLEAGALPVQESLTLLDRMALYADRHSNIHPILSFQDHAYFVDSEVEALSQTAQELMTGAGILPEWIFQEEPFDLVEASRTLLWDPAGGDVIQEPSAFWEIKWSYYSNKNHLKSIALTLDAETGLPIYFYVHDTNISQWLPYELDSLRALAERFFTLLEMEVQEAGPGEPRYVPSLDLSYAVAGSPVGFRISRGPTELSVEMDIDWRNAEASDGSSAADAG